MLVLSSQSCYLYKITCKGFDLMYGCSIMHEAFFKFLVLQFQKENLKKSSLHPHSFVVVLKLSFPELFFFFVKVYSEQKNATVQGMGRRVHPPLLEEALKKQTKTAVKNYAKTVQAKQVSFISNSNAINIVSGHVANSCLAG